MAAVADTVENIKVKITDSVEIPILTRCCFCIPLRKGLITMAYVNLVLTGIILPTYASFIFTYDPNSDHFLTYRGRDLMPQLCIEFVALIIEFLMTIMFLVGLHMKRVLLMRIYLYFGLIYTVFSLVYNVTILSLSEETAGEFVLIIAQLLIHIYFMILVWSSIVKMSRDGSVKYTRSVDEA